MDKQHKNGRDWPVSANVAAFTVAAVAVAASAYALSRRSAAAPDSKPRQTPGQPSKRRLTDDQISRVFRAAPWLPPESEPTPPPKDGPTPMQIYWNQRFRDATVKNMANFLQYLLKK
jgi:hypothetical protein